MDFNIGRYQFKIIRIDRTPWVNSKCIHCGKKLTSKDSPVLVNTNSNTNNFAHQPCESKFWRKMYQEYYE